jgi:hypothetical protein
MNDFRRKKVYLSVAGSTIDVAEPQVATSELVGATR